MEWHRVYQNLTEPECNGEKLVGELLNEIVCSVGEFENFFSKVIEGKFYQFGESDFLHMPVNVLEDEEEGYGKYKGEIYISRNNFDGKENIGWIRLDKFCFYVKLAAVFHSKYVDTSFDPWGGFQKLDQMQAEYYPYPKSNT